MSEEVPRPPDEAEVKGADSSRQLHKPLAKRLASKDKFSLGFMASHFARVPCTGAT